MVSDDSTAEPGEAINSNDLCQTALPLLTDLLERNALPAILFNFDRSKCELIAKTIFNRLQQAETSWKRTNSKWRSLIEGYEKWNASKNTKPPKESKSKKSNDTAGERLSRTDVERESAEREGSRYEFFNPNAPCEEFSFADLQKVENSEMEDYFKKLEWKGVAPWLILALKRGIGIHHAGMNRKYRQT